jgi:hypothetical protein
MIQADANKVREMEGNRRLLTGMVEIALLKQNPPTFKGYEDCIKFDVETPAVMVRFMGRLWKITAEDVGPAPVGDSRQSEEVSHA